MIVETFHFHVMIRELNRIYHTFETIRMSQTLKGDSDHCQMPWVRARNFQKGSRGNLGELEVAQVYGAIGAAGVAANQMKTATFISLIFGF
jgi:hypothetical protein